MRMADIHGLVNSAFDSLSNANFAALAAWSIVPTKVPTHLKVTIDQAARAAKFA